MTIQAQCDQWNQAHPIYSPVIYEGKKYSTRTFAFVTMWGSVALIFLVGLERPVRLDSIAAIEEERTKGANS